MQAIIFENKTQSKVNKKPFVAPTPIVQKKLAIGASNDAYEVEADHVADQVVNMSDTQVQTKPQTGSLIQRKCAACEQEEKLQMKPLGDTITPLVQKSSMSSGNESTASEAITNQINSSKGGGKGMGASTQSYMESRFGTDFSGVKIHTDSKAVQLSRDLNAQAFTVGNDIYFNEGKYNPDSNSGKHLLAHELTHTIQQKGIQKKSIQREIHSGHDDNGRYAFNDTTCEFDYHQNWYFQFNVPLSDSEKTRLMNLAATQVHDTWSEQYPLIPVSLAGFINCPCKINGVKVSVNIHPSEGEREGRGIQVSILPSVRAFVNPVFSTMSLQQTDFAGYTHSTTSGHQYTVAHEFGHTIDITDEYNGWAGFFVPSVQRDERAIMNSGNQIRPRHYQYFGDMLSLEILGCRYNPNGLRQPERENPVIRATTLSGLTSYQDGMNLFSPNSRYNFGSNYDLRVSNQRLFGLFYPQIGGVRLWNPDTGSQSDYGITAGIRLGQIAHPLVFNLRTGIVTNPLNPSSSLRMPVSIQAGLRSSNYEFGIHYTPVVNLLDGDVTHLLGAGLRF